jgi:hypothetical protein
MSLDYAGVTLRNKDLMPTTFHPMDPMDQKKSSSEHQRMLGIADVKPVAEQDTDKSDAPEMVPVTQGSSRVGLQTTRYYRSESKVHR